MYDPKVRFLQSHDCIIYTMDCSLRVKGTVRNFPYNYATQVQRPICVVYKKSQLTFIVNPSEVRLKELQMDSLQKLVLEDFSVGILIKF